METAIDDLPIEQNTEANRFEIHHGSDVARLEYRLSDSTIVFTHTGVPRAMSGHGIAARLARHGLNYARANGLSVVPLCPYVAAYIRQHQEYADLVASRATQESSESE